LRIGQGFKPNPRGPSACPNRAVRQGILTNPQDEIST
jgi:hypothetical protein